MTGSIATARGIVRTLLTYGVRDVVLCPGSRSAPLAYATAEAEAAGRLRLHVRTDERSAAFLALGLGIGDPGRPAVVITTSGTAVANLHPAVLEAYHARVPVVLLTADRPAHLQGTWANQTTPLQARLFGDAVTYATDAREAVLRSLGWREASERRGSAPMGRGERLAPGPVHLNVGFDEPLHLAGQVSHDYPEPGPAVGQPVLATGPELDRVPRTVVVAGDRAGRGASDLADRAGWPLFAEPSSGVLPSPWAVPGYRLLDLTRIERAVVFGRPTLSRPVTALLNRPEVDVVHVVEYPTEPGPGRRYTQVVGPPAAPSGTTQDDIRWRDTWLERGRRARAVIDDALAAAAAPAGPRVAAAVVESARPGEALVVASSNAVRDLDLVADRLPPDVSVVANRGLAGIDGTIATAMGVALASGRPTRLLIGDLAFLHDVNALNLAPGERVPDLQLVVVNDRGGAIFSTLEYGARADFFERVFGTPHRVDLAGLTAAHGVPVQTVEPGPELSTRLGQPIIGLSVVEVAAYRESVRDFQAGLARRVREQDRSVQGNDQALSGGDENDRATEQEDVE